MGMISINDAWPPDALEMHKSYVYKVIERALAAEPELGSVSRAFIRSHRHDIAHGRPAALRRVIACADILKCALSVAAYEDFVEDCKKVFNYDAFSSIKPPNWGAYALCSASKYSMCPYCHQSFAHTLVPDGHGSFRPTLDHYYPKALYPYLALSVFNLVPSCYTCNSQLKGTKNFYEEVHVHPLEGCIDGVDFVLDVGAYIEARRAGTSDYRLEVRGRSDAAAKSISTFALGKRFSINDAYLDSFIARVLDYINGAATRSKINPGLGFGLAEADIIGFDAENYKNEMLGKIKLDLYGIILTR
ncbi:hypothetical protein ROV94_07540 [Stenotrophomonas maltophilia]|uniref:hypothetical protein n=1 Tax=Stenotrophomonas maltophilia TaxID=40324 RepID=UPI002894EF56|nr:hypothetical protein [Stenotrophomonas maltophilia]MDT3430720.1 hypothetical protein [Stenotrophomonas maltophilia]